MSPSKTSKRKGNAATARKPQMASPVIVLPDPVPVENPAEIHFNFGMIKQLAQPGSWRRGYGYFREKNVRDITFTPDGVEAHVKGKFKEAYNIKLNFRLNPVQANCSCPLEEPWCKHAVAVALECVRQNLWEEFWDLPIEDPKHPLDPATIKGDHYFVIRIASRPVTKQKGKTKQSKNGGKTLDVQMVRRAGDEPVKELEKTLRDAVQVGENKFNDAQKREFNLMQLALKQGHVRSGNGWYSFPIKDSQDVIDLLALVEDVRDTNGNRILFEQESLKLLMSVNVSMAGNVLVSLHWVRQNPYDAYPLEEVTLFHNNTRWGWYRDRIYRLANNVDKLPGKLARASFLDIRDADGGKFMHEVLPKLQKAVDMDLADMARQVSFKDKPPQKILTLEQADDASIKVQARLEFSYDGVKVPYSKKSPDSPYVMVVNKETQNIYWARRNMQAEEKAFAQLEEGGLEALQTNLFWAEGDNAIDFYNHTLPHLRDDAHDPWQVKTKGELERLLKASVEPLTMRASLNFSESVDQFILKVDCVVGTHEMSLDQVQRYLQQGKKYFFFGDMGHVEIPLATILQFGKALQAFDAEEIEKDTWKIQTYKAGLLGELSDMGIQLNHSKKFRKFWNVISSNESMEEVEVPKSVNAELRAYQKQGFNWLWFLYSYGLNGILADDMGLGKTLQTLVTLQHARDVDGQQPSLIVCPSTIVFNWVNEAQKFVPDLKVIRLTGSERHIAYKQIAEADLVITSYALLRRDVRALKEYNFRYLVLDESQNIKNYDSQTAVASKRLQASHCLALSGTPIENRLSELWSVFDYLMPGFLYDIEEFKYRYINPIEEKGNRDAERRLKKQVFPFILRRLKQDVAKDLPPKIETIKYCELTDRQQDLYIDLLDKTRDEVFSKLGGADPNAKSQMSIFSALLRLRQVCNHPSLMGEELSHGLNESGKFETLKSMVEEIISEGGRILLYSQFVEMLKLVRSWLEVKGIKHEYLTGETRDRENAVYRFNNDESIPIMLISLKAGGVGLNLTGADYVIHYDPWWNPAAEDQATDRAHRIGQSKTVFVYRLITKGTVEEKIMKLKDRKRDLVDSIIAADRSVGKMLSFQDLKEILSADFS
ncbi:MAG: SNF2-related protein [Candidatus Melainabacteria bacterium]